MAETANEILTYIEMCQREKTSLQRGMKFRLGGTYSAVLMSVRLGAPYADRIEEDGKTLIYEGHDATMRPGLSDPKSLDQPEFLDSGSLTQNGLFYYAARKFARGSQQPEMVRVYEKVRQGIWSPNGLFTLEDAWKEARQGRQAFCFKLTLVDQPIGPHVLRPQPVMSHGRLIPSEVKVEVWKRDNGRCVLCGATDELHFDHVLPYSRGGTSVTARNVQLLCARHNLQKSARIEGHNVMTY